MGLVHYDGSADWSKQYSCDEKIELRNVLIEAASDVQPRKILTLPSREGLCAIQFREAFPNSEIIGIERSEMIVEACTSRLVGNPPSIEQPLDALYCTSVAKVLKSEPVLIPVPTNDGNRNKMRTIRISLRDFDMAFLDYTGMFDNYVEEAFRFIRERMKQTAVCGLTFSHDGNQEKLVRRLESLSLNNAASLVHHTFYRNGTGKNKAPMLFAIVRKH